MAATRKEQGMRKVTAKGHFKAQEAQKGIETNVDDEISS